MSDEIDDIPELEDMSEVLESIGKNTKPDPKHATDDYSLTRDELFAKETSELDKKMAQALTSGKVREPVPEPKKEESTSLS